MRNANYYIFKQKLKENGQKSTFFGSPEFIDLSRVYVRFSWGDIEGFMKVWNFHIYQLGTPQDSTNLSASLSSLALLEQHPTQESYALNLPP